MRGEMTRVIIYTSLHNLRLRNPALSRGLGAKDHALQILSANVTEIVRS
jgi:hypothetical protein